MELQAQKDRLVKKEKKDTKVNRARQDRRDLKVN
jgi:hypothetical protein